MLIEYQEKILNNKVLTAANLNNNFDVIKNVINGNINGDNIKKDSELTLRKIATQKLKTQIIKVGQQIIITLPDSAGASSVKFRDKNNVAVMTVYSDGRTEI